MTPEVHPLVNFTCESLPPTTDKATRLTSVARHHELGPIALAVVKRNTRLDAVCMVAGLSANQEEIVPRG